jgi:hypothetical protein
MTTRISDETRAKNHAWHRANKERLTALQKARREADPVKAAKIARNSALKANYGITVSEYDAMFKSQRGKCAICSEKYGKTLHVDHCHRTNKVRGLLCHKCNMAIGLLQDSTKLLNRAISYLQGV